MFVCIKATYVSLIKKNNSSINILEKNMFFFLNFVHKNVTYNRIRYLDLYVNKNKHTICKFGLMEKRDLYSFLTLYLG